MKPLKIKERNYLPKDYVVTTWETLEPFYTELKNREITSKETLLKWFEDRNELDAVVSEESSWRYIRTSCDTTNEKYEEDFNYFNSELEPKIKEQDFDLDNKFIKSEFVKDLDQDLFKNYIRTVNTNIILFRQENIPLIAELSILEQQYGSIVSKMTIEIEGKELTLSQASVYLQSSNRELREEVYRKTTARRLQDKDTLNELFDKLLNLRNQIAKNAGFENYRDYKFVELERDYKLEDCYQFHESIKEHIVPLRDMLVKNHMEELGLTDYRPWDTAGIPENKTPLKPYKTIDELIKKSIGIFNKINPYFGDCISTMLNMKRLDLDNRKGKAPGGYNMSLMETGAPFIFMNSVGTQTDVNTMMHEGGHAIHSFLSYPLQTAFKDYPSELAELASMSMELFSMEHWNDFYENEEEFNRAKIEQLEGSITILPWVAMVDKFQHWIYTNIGHSVKEREDAWISICDEFSSNMVNWDGLEESRANMWHKQLHIFEIPFYYIEYGISQLGALSMWKQYNENKEQTITNYIACLSKGYTKNLKELYNIAGIKFDFSPDYIKGLKEFVGYHLYEMMEDKFLIDISNTGGILYK